MISRYFILCVCSFLLVSCGPSFKSYKYTPMYSLKEFNGTYMNDGDSLAGALGLPYDIDLVTLKFESLEKLNISYMTDTGKVSLTYKGKLKNNYFETYLEKKRIIAVIINAIITDKIRIGKNTEGVMLIHHTYDKVAVVPFINGVSDKFEHTYTQQPLEKGILYPFEEDGKWGYKTNSDSVIIVPQYDYAKLFEDNIARVKLNGKWALINQEGKLLTDYKYDKIDKYSEYMYSRKVYIENKIRYLNKNGCDITAEGKIKKGYIGS